MCSRTQRCCCVHWWCHGKQPWWVVVRAMFLRTDGTLAIAFVCMVSCFLLPRAGPSCLRRCVTPWPRLGLPLYSMRSAWQTYTTTSRISFTMPTPSARRARSSADQVHMAPCGTCMQKESLRRRHLPDAFQGHEHVSAIARNHHLVMIPVLATFLLVLLKRCVSLVHRKQMSQAQLVTVIFVTTSMLNGMLWSLDVIADVAVDAGHLHNLSNALDGMLMPCTDACMRSRTAPSHPPPASVIGLDHVTFGYDNQNQVIRDMSLHFERGRCTALQGAIGRGKSTIIKLLLGFCRPVHGD